jgi:hypothetical protein
VGGEVRALTVFDDGSGGGTALYAGGDFTFVGYLIANNIAKWDGSSWSVLGSGIDSEYPYDGLRDVIALTVFDDGSGGGTALYAGGYFRTAGGVTANSIAKWDGSSWEALASGTDNAVVALTVFDDGSGVGPALYAGGNFRRAGGVASGSVARWTGCPVTPTPCPGDANGGGQVNFDDMTTVLANFGSTTASYGLGDADGSGQVNFDDMTTVLANFGTVCGP